MDIEFCQSCGMPMNDNDYGTNVDGTTNKDYCNHCYDNGEFTSDRTMDDMINFCAPKMAENTGIDESEARKIMEEMFPNLKRWKNNK
ncbi:zinc ribbon domain-containing protein [Methanobrevibacter sp. TMH8]|uniref:zinc ribbon domain-containing protein n=1 Tax=Methanobrevibacter sp. TMH8 TaxID=2848611 RepID=UPI001CCCC800|nr:zinc ribbon domain-containing protein [Methanobrevibacter sp. TMH8]MBZ9570387.1 zinc ribbon domain-containing protein [Methanobrevibacter sp. TMH8]